jgi:sugar lactone lactonase YvrE
MPLVPRCRAAAAPARRVATLIAASAVALSTAVLAAPTARAADTVTPLPGVSGVGDVAAGGGRILVAAVDRLIIADTAGTVTGTIGDLPGAVGLALSPDGSRAYLALRDANQVAVVDPARRRIVRRIDLAAYSCPSNLALSGGRLWVAYGCDSWGGGVLSFDPAAGNPVPVVVESGLYGAPAIAAAGSVLAFGELGLSPATAQVWTIGAGGTATRRGTVPPGWGDASNLQDLALSPDGRLLVTAAGYPYRHVGWDTTTLAEVRSYGEGIGYYPNAVAFSPDGSKLAAGRGSDPEVSVHDTASAAALYQDDVPELQLLAGTLAFSGGDVVGAVRNWSAGSYFLWVLRGAALPASTIALTAPASATALEPLTVTGRLTVGDGGSPGVQQLTVTRELSGGTTMLPPVTTAADGSFAITDTPPGGGEATYRASWAGSSAYRGSDGAVRVPVAKRTATLSLTGPETADAGQELRFTGRLTVEGPAPVAPVPLSVERRVSNNRRTQTDRLADVGLAADGTFAFSDTPTEGGQYVYTVRWSGSDVYAAADASHALGVSSTASLVTGLMEWPAYVGEAYTVAGGVSFDVGDCVGPTTLHVRRQVGAGPEEQRPDVTTDETCSFRFTDTQTVPGGVRYVVSWDGDATHQASSTEIYGWVAKQPSSLDAQAADYYIGPGERVEITGTLVGSRTGPLAGQEVTVTRTDPDGTVGTLASVTTTRTGSFTIRDRSPQADPLQSFRYDIGWAGNGTYDGASTVVTVYVTATG